MAVALVGNGALAGALAGLAMGRINPVSDPADANIVNQKDVAVAFQTQFLTANTALGGAAMADADNANIFLVCYAAAFAVMAGRAPVSETATDYAALASQAVALAKATVASLA